MKLQILFLVTTLFGFTACDRTDQKNEVEEFVPSQKIETISTKPAPRVEVVIAEAEPDPPVPSEEKVPAGTTVVYEAGDTFEGMWNYDRRSASLRLTIRSIAAETRTITATMQSSDLDNAEKKFEGTIGLDGRQMTLIGIAGTGSEYERVDGYDVRDFLRKGSTMQVNLDDCNARKLRGSVENGTNIYFWSEVKPAESGQAIELHRPGHLR